MEPRVDGASAITEYDVYLFREGTHFRLHAKLGAHPNAHEGRGGTRFALWAPAAHAVSVVGDFNGWREGETPLGCRHDGSGIWEGFVPMVGNGSAYLFHISSPGF